MLDMIVQRRAASMKEERDDLFSNLLAANDEEEGEQKLSDEELIGASQFWSFWTYLTRHPGNVWIMLVAGHEVFTLIGCRNHNSFNTVTDYWGNTVLCARPTGDLPRRTSRSIQTDPGDIARRRISCEFILLSSRFIDETNTVQKYSDVSRYTRAQA